MSLSTSNIFAALDTKKKKKSSKSSKESGDKKQKEIREPDRFYFQINMASCISSAFMTVDRISRIRGVKCFQSDQSSADMHLSWLQGPNLAAAPLFWPGQACSNQLGGH
jgi:hypothetical protein